MLWLITRAVGKLKCFITPSNTRILYINIQRMSTAFLFLFVSACRNNRNYWLWEQGGQTHTHTHRRTPERRRTTAGRTAHTNHARRTEGREETGTQRQPNGKPAERQARQAEPQPRGNHDGRGKRTKRTHTHRRRTRKQRTNNTGNTPKEFICLLALIFIYQVFNYKVKGFTRLADVFFRSQRTRFTSLALNEKNALDVPTFEHN